MNRFGLDQSGPADSADLASMSQGDPPASPQTPGPAEAAVQTPREELVRVGRIVEVRKPPPPVMARPDQPPSMLSQPDGAPRLYIEPDAFAALAAHIGWGQTTETNVVEQAGVIVGQMFRDNETEEMFGVVAHVLDAQTSDSSAVSLTMNHDAWAGLIKRFDSLEAPSDGSEWRMLGWYHTHPNGLDVFMSGADRQTQRDFFSGLDSFALVFNPHRRIWKGFQGGDCLECKVVVLACRTDQNSADPAMRSDNG